MINQAILDNISKKLKLRQPNKEAAQVFLEHYYNSEKLSEYILLVATGVGKTYIIAAILNYLAETQKITNFLIVAPGKIIREKTISKRITNQNFTRIIQTSFRSIFDINFKGFNILNIISG